MNFKYAKPRYTKTALHLSCQQLCQEVFEYYYSRNTFRLDLPNTFITSQRGVIQRHFDLVKVLRIDAPKFFWKSSDRAKTSQYIEEGQWKLDKFLASMFESNPICAPNLQTLVFVDTAPVRSSLWDRSLDVGNFKERVNDYLQVLDRFQLGVGQVVIRAAEGSLADGDGEVFRQDIDRLQKTPM